MDIQIFSTAPKKQKTAQKKTVKKDKDTLNSDATLPTKFSDFGFDSWVIQVLQSVAIDKPTPIQCQAIPKIFDGCDLIASAKTGSGKTAAFALPILQSLSRDPFGVFSLVLTPTRELAHQIAEQFKIYGKDIHLKLSVVVGGLDMMAQARELVGRPHVVVATPGRLADIFNSCSDVLPFHALRFLVLDEADRLLDSSFRPDLDVIFRNLGPKKQTLLFSATMPKSMDDLEFLKLKNLAKCQVTEEYGTVDKIQQKYILIPSRIRIAYLVYLLQNDWKEKSVIIFVGKCKTAEMLRQILRKFEIKVTALHSQMSQYDRTGSLAKFKGNIVPVLISTDVGSRGLDIPDVQVVINFDIPCDAKDYVHRIGRTARAGRGGIALSIVSEHDIELIQNIESKIKKQLDEYEVSEDSVLEILGKVMEARREALMNMEDHEFGKRRKINEQKRKK